jgi:hypothetical protein
MQSFAEVHTVKIFDREVYDAGMRHAFGKICRALSHKFKKFEMDVRYLFNLKRGYGLQ